MTAVLVASDLDQTLIFSPRAAARGPSRPSRVVEVLDGRTISLLSHDTERDLAELDRSAVLVPSTTRTRAQFTRIDLPFASRYAVVASGAVVLVDGEPDVDWSRAVAARLGEASAPLTALRDLFTGYQHRQGGREWLLRVRDADDVFLVAAVDADLLAGDELDGVRAGCTELGWRAVHQGRKLYVLPAGLDKAAAVQHVAERVAAESGSAPLVLAAGDTELDWGMLQAASAGWVPAGSELDRLGLDRLGLSAPHVTRTEHAGLAASEQIVAECLAHAAAARAGAAASDRGQPPRA